jgi:cysteinyl-tRNA synthetase
VNISRIYQGRKLASGPVLSGRSGIAQAAFDDLDTRRALTLLRDLALDASVPTGAKFETFLYVDRILGLELAREIGQPRD